MICKWSKNVGILFVQIRAAYALFGDWTVVQSMQEVGQLQAVHHSLRSSPTEMSAMSPSFCNAASFQRHFCVERHKDAMHLKEITQHSNHLFHLFHRFHLFHLFIPGVTFLD